MERNLIDDTFYNNETKQILFNNLNNDDKKYYSNNNLDLSKFLFLRWRTIISSLMSDHYQEYATLKNENRNIWFDTYINLPYHDMNEMPRRLCYNLL